MPDLKKELSYFAINPFTREKLTVETLLDIVTFDDNNNYILDDKVKVVDNKVSDTFDFYDLKDGQWKIIAKTPQSII